MPSIQGEPEYLSPQKHKELEEELQELKTTRRKEVADRLEQAKGFGDLSENAEYDEARNVQAKLEERIAQIESILKRAVIIEESKTKSDLVRIGTKVNVKRDDGTDFVWQIVGSAEADVEQGKISNESPIGRAVLGKKKGEDFVVETPKGKTKYKIVGVG